MAYELKVNTGAVNVPVYDENGVELGSFSFVPSDTNILKRYKKVAEDLNNLSTDVKTEDDMIMLSDKVAELFDYLFNADASKTLFKKASPLTVLEDGSFFFQQIIEGVGHLMEQIQSERAEARKKIEEAVAGYDE